MDTLCLLSDSINYNQVDQLYEVDCDIIILENDTLRIYPGETVMFFQYFPPGNTIRFRIEIYGCLLAIGAEDKQITLGDPNCSLSSGNWWGGVLFFNTSHNGESKIKYCNFRGITNIEIDKQTAIYCENSSPIIDHTSIKYMGSGEETGGCAAIGLRDESHPVISYCSFQSIITGVAIWCNMCWYIDSIQGPNPLIFGCNIYSSVSGFFLFPSDYDHVVLRGGFLDNCYLKVPFSNLADTTLGFPIDTVGDGTKSTTSTYEGKARFLCVDGVVNPRGDTVLTGINRNETEILPTTSQYLILKNCYPNPFDNFTTIEFELKRASTNVLLVIIDSKGNRVKTLINNLSNTSGEYDIKWYGDNDAGQRVINGIYFYKLVSGNSLLVKKAIVVK